MGGWYPSLLIVHQQRYQPSDSNKKANQIIILSLGRYLCRGSNFSEGMIRSVVIVSTYGFTYYKY